jgi:hypothetical protein
MSIFIIRPNLEPALHLVSYLLLAAAQINVLVTTK